MVKEIGIFNNICCIIIKFLISIIFVNSINYYIKFTFIPYYLKKKKKDFWEELTEEQKLDIEEGERQIERGEFVEYETMMKKYR